MMRKRRQGLPATAAGLFRSGGVWCTGLWLKKTIRYSMNARWNSVDWVKRK